MTECYYCNDFLLGMSPTGAHTISLSLYWRLKILSVSPCVFAWEGPTRLNDSFHFFVCDSFPATGISCHVRFVFILVGLYSSLLAMLHSIQACYWLFGLAAFVLHTVHGQRQALCFDQEDPPICDFLGDISDEASLEELIETIFESEQAEIYATCRVILTQYAPTEDALFKSDWWDPAWFDTVTRDSAECDRLRRYFSYCAWCSEDVCGFVGPDNEQANPNNQKAEEQESNGLETTPISRILSCQAPQRVDNPFQAQIFCQAFDEHFLHFGVQHYREKHAIAVAGMEGLPMECDAMSQIYSSCYFCDNRLTAQHNFCSYETLCQEAAQLLATGDDDAAKYTTTAELEETCELLNFIAQENLVQPYTTDLCEKAPAALALGCPQFCQPCFDAMEHPLTCSAFRRSRRRLDEDGAEEEEYGGEEEGYYDGETDGGAFVTCTELSFLLADQIGNRSQHMEILSSVRALSPNCALYREHYHECFWCDDDVLENLECWAAEVCQPPGSVVPFTGEDAMEFHVACQDLRGVYAEDTVPLTIDLCRKARRYGRNCPCIEEQESLPYLGAETSTQKRALIWVSRVSALLSFVGALCILFDVWKKRSTERGRDGMPVYSRLMLCMAWFDLCTAIAWGFASAPIDSKYDIVGARGNEATCTTQGFFIQLGFTSIFFNVSLALHYYLVIVRGWREFDLRNYAHHLIATPVLIGFGLALGGLPFYEGFEYGCHLQPVPVGELWVVLLFVVLPVGISILFITTVMFLLYKKVRDQSLAGSRWSMRMSQNSASLDRRVFWQALFYTMSFYITWPVMLCVYVSGWDFDRNIYGFSLLVAFVAPLQGFNNSLAYFRPSLQVQCMLRRRNPFIGWTSGSRSQQKTDSSHLSKGKKEESENPKEPLAEHADSCTKEKDVESDDPEEPLPEQAQSCSKENKVESQDRQKPLSEPMGN